MTSESVADSELVAFRLQPLLQRPEVLDHAVVNDRQDAVAANVGVGVHIVGGTVGCPSRVPDADATRYGGLSEPRLQPLDPPSRLGDQQAAIGADRGHARAVVAPIGQPSKPSDEEIHRFLGANIADNSAH